MNAAAGTKRFAGKSILVSGGAGGFGRAIARAFCGDGARVLVTDIDEQALEGVTNDLREEFGSEEFGAEVVALAGDVALEETAARLVETAVRRFGGLDVAVNNAGIDHGYARLPEISAHEAARVFAVNLTGVFFAMKHQIPAMETRSGGSGSGRGGAIVNMASVAGLVGAPLLSVYAAAKHGVVGLTKSAALENARRGIRINAVCPSFARTKMVLDQIGDADPAAEAEIARGIPMRRIAEVDEVVAAVLFAADPANGFMTGASLPVDGGLTAL